VFFLSLIQVFRLTRWHYHYRGAKEDQVMLAPLDRNSFLAELSAADLELVRPHLTNFRLTAGDRLRCSGDPIEQVVFPHSGVIGTVMHLSSGESAGAILVGWNGILGGLEAAAAAPLTCDAEVYIQGRAARMSASAFRHVLDQSPPMRRLLARYDAALMMQAHQTALCNAAHPVEARVSRWLLEVLDRSGGFDVPLTQFTLSQMLGVQRTTINLALRRLEAAGVIRRYRANIQIKGRERLESHACECYDQVRNCLSSFVTVPAAAPIPAMPIAGSLINVCESSMARSAKSQQAD
jgi:CRP-like cAMP-binding protein